MGTGKLAIVIPVFNEEVSIGKVLEEWKTELFKENIPFVFIVIDDGSRDSTPQVLQAFHDKNKDLIQIVKQTNQGHGQACVNGYYKALETDAIWIMQIDSDGQCDPKFAREFWQNRAQDLALIGHRRSRDDGQVRMYVSKVLSLAIFFGVGVWVKDSNVPYRLFHRSLLKRHLHKIPTDFFLANALLTAMFVKYEEVLWIPIHFRDRHGGSPSLQGIKLFKRGASIFADFFRYRESAHRPELK
jgi:dolichol-phosphate mannosyltransferase